MLKTISTVLTVLFALVWVLFFRPVFLGGNTSYIIVSGISMEPTYYTGDLVVMRKAGQYHVGDVIAYRVEKNNVIHRIVGGTASTGFLTQGDNKPEVDPWTPKPDDILGKLWFHVPAAGEKLNGLQSPTGMAGLAGLTVLLFIDDLFPAQKKTRRGKRMKTGSSGSLPFRFTVAGWFTRQNSAQHRQVASWLLPVTVTGLVVGAFCLAAAVYSAFQPARKLEPVTQTRYTHHAVFQYIIHTQPSPLFSGTVIGPIGPETVLTADLPPVVTNLAQSIDIDLDYRLKDFRDGNLNGQIKTVLRVEMGEDWKQNFALGEAVSFQGSEVNTRITIPMDQFRGWVDAIVQEVGYYPSAYTVKVIPAITLTGIVDGEPVNETYSPEFNITFRATQAQMETELVRSEEKFTEKMEERDQYFRFWRINWRVEDIQHISSLLAFILLPSGSILALLLFFWLHNDELFLIQLRYGGMLIAVEQVDLHQSRQIQVASMKDLARLAQQYGGVIFRKAYNDGSCLFFIPDGQITYLLMIADPKKGA